MPLTPPPIARPAWFDRVEAMGRTIPGVEVAAKYDGSPVLRLDGVFMAGVGARRWAEPDSLVVRYDVEARVDLLADAPDTYYVTDYHAPYPVVLARIGRLDDAALGDLLRTSARLTRAKTRSGRKPRQTPRPPV